MNGRSVKSKQVEAESTIAGRHALVLGGSLAGLLASVHESRGQTGRAPKTTTGSTLVYDAAASD